MRKLISLLWVLVYITAAPLYAAEDDHLVDAEHTDANYNSDETGTRNQEEQQVTKADAKAGAQSAASAPQKETAPTSNASAPAAKTANGAALPAEKNAAAKDQANKSAAPEKQASKAEEKPANNGKKVEADNTKKEESAAAQGSRQRDITEQAGATVSEENKKPAKAAEEAQPAQPAQPQEEESAPAAAAPQPVTPPVQEAVKAEKPIPVHPAYYNPEESEIEAVDIDTIDLSEPKGNWLLKRQWWEAAERAYEQIKKIVDQIFDARLTFYNERTELDRTVFNNFFHSVGMGQGELQEIVETLTQEMNQNSKDKGSLNKKEQDVMVRVREEKDRLKKLYDTIENINEIEKALNAALITMREQIETARKNERDAWDNFKKIARELSDHKAYELYYAMNSFMTNVSEIYKYLHGPFADYYRQLGARAKKDIEEVLASMKVLKEKGIDLKQQAEELIHKQNCARPVAEKEKEEPQEEEPAGFFGTMWYYIKAPFIFIASSFADAYDGVRSLFVKAPVDEESADAEGLRRDKEAVETAKPKQNKEKATEVSKSNKEEAAVPKKVTPVANSAEQKNQEEQKAPATPKKTKATETTE